MDSDSSFDIRIKTEDDEEPLRLTIVEHDDDRIQNGENAIQPGQPSVPIFAARTGTLGDAQRTTIETAQRPVENEVQAQTEASAGILRESVGDPAGRRFIILMKPNDTAPGFIRNTPACSSSEIDLQQSSFLPPLPPLKRIPQPASQTIPTAVTVPNEARFTRLRPAAPANTNNGIVVSTGRVRWPTRTFRPIYTIVPSTNLSVPSMNPVTSTLPSMVESGDERKTKRRRPRPKKNKDPTPEESEKIDRFKQLLRGQLPSVTSSTSPPATRVDAEESVGVYALVSSGDGISESTSTESTIPAVVNDFIRSPSPSQSPAASPSAADSTDLFQLRRMRKNETARRSRRKARMRVKQSEMNCRTLVRQFGEMKEKILELQRQLRWERKRNQMLEERLRQSKEWTDEPITHQEHGMLEGMLHTRQEEWTGNEEFHEDTL